MFIRFLHGDPMTIIFGAGGVSISNAPSPATQDRERSAPSSLHLLLSEQLSNTCAAIFHHGCLAALSRIDQEKD
jgi:hypothetical protein